MCDGDNLQVEFLPPARIVKERSFLLPVIITNTAEIASDEPLSGTIQIGPEFDFKPSQTKKIRFGQLIPGQKIVLTWILLATKEGVHPVTVHVHAADKTVIEKSTFLVVQP